MIIPANLSLKRPAPMFPELEINNKTTSITKCQRWRIRPRKRSRSEYLCDSPKGVSSDDWMELESMLDDDLELEALPISLEANEYVHEEEETIPNNFTKMSRTCSVEDLRSTLISSSAAAPRSRLYDETSFISSGEDKRHIIPTVHEEGSPIAMTMGSETNKGKDHSEAELLTLTSFPFRIFSADDNFFRLTGLASSTVVGEPLLSVFTMQQSELGPRIMDSPWEYFGKDGNTVSVPSGQGGVSTNGAPASNITRTMKIEAVWGTSQDQKQTAQVSHYRVTLH
ncbi:unnamed protein product [Cylindrotheca closterium]|uniref:PAS domain-containing protein n=1 Tax=Cylindrotheca closterium TaxID=2856 RepID=A0AAD2CIE5_9STRA|nr:unnamed protein product [Cylindrotheca closterium]